MMTNMEANKKLSAITTKLLSRDKNIQNVTFFIMILFQSAQNYKTKRSTFFYREKT